ncbi:MAG: PEP-CTERM sorting domain-containing protein [Candidatus Omnitrophica bacterium]|nr:PEP-CTERM sorting domain-containing protein [Candidatus Omnitrophota bacterium]
MKKIVVVAVLILIFGFAGSAYATVTPISYPTGYSEKWLDRDRWLSTSIIGTLFGLNNVTRIDDDLDQIWAAGANANVRAVAKYAGDAQRLYAGTTHLLDITSGNFCSLTSGATAGFTASGAFKFYDDSGPAGGTIWSSLVSENSDGRDHMVTYRIINSGGTNYSIGDYVIAWEDGTDWDYNDMVFVLHDVTNNPETSHATPEPATMALMGLGLAGLVARKKKRI